MEWALLRVGEYQASKREKQCGASRALSRGDGGRAGRRCGRDAGALLPPLALHPGGHICGVPGRQPDETLALEEGGHARGLV